MLGPQLGAAAVGRSTGRDTGSGFTGGGVWYLDKDLRTLLGDEVQGAVQDAVLRRRRRGACRAAVWGAFDAAGDALAAAQGTADAGAWKSRRQRGADHLRARACCPTTIRYTNRPSGIQQVISFTGHRKTRK